jgi:hypothetical protein
MKWQPIETAPTDSTMIIGYQLQLPERWVHVGLGSNSGGRWLWQQDVRWGSATHWIPCPSFPRQP